MDTINEALAELRKCVKRTIQVIAIHELNEDQELDVLAELKGEAKKLLNAANRLQNGDKIPYPD